jgi:hypothetical protein
MEYKLKITKQNLTLMIATDFHRRLKIESAKRKSSMTNIVISSVEKYLENTGNVEAPKQKQITKLPGKNSQPVFQFVDVSNIARAKNMKRGPAVESLAKSILEIGLLKPLILQQTGVGSYICLSPIQELSAVLRAKELNPIKCEMVNAMVVSGKHVEQGQKQITLLKALK